MFSAGAFFASVLALALYCLPAVVFTLVYVRQRRKMEDVAAAQQDERAGSVVCRLSLGTTDGGRILYVVLQVDLHQGDVLAQALVRGSAQVAF